ncbi:MAG: sodium:proton antiporter [Clostridia bacterium]|nr:sodium:proton antiporter [Clostridia bacterium]MBO4884538.1 sodium:proton antiporter [Clostridia bacterium]MBR4443532.1 sodium:proton antiporter [Clostridia bacterium]
MTPESAREVFFNIVLGIQGIILFFCLIRSIIGPSVSDRIVAVNMVGTNTIAIIAVLAVKLGESYLADIGLIYAMLSFLAVVLLTKVYMGAYREKKMRELEKEKKEAEPQ